MPPPIQYRIEPPLVRIWLEIPYDASELAEAARRLLEDPAFVPGLNVLAEVPLGALPDTEAVRERAKLIQQLAPRIGSRIAVVVQRDVDYGIGRMFGTFVEEVGLHVRMFRDVEAAEAWLRSETD